MVYSLYAIAYFYTSYSPRQRRIARLVWSIVFCTLSTPVDHSSRNLLCRCHCSTAGFVCMVC